MHLIEITKRFASKEACGEYLAALRWKNGIVCAKCGVEGNEHFRHFKTAETKRQRFSKKEGKKVWVRVPSRSLYECKGCGYQFSATVGTLFHDSHLDLLKWFQAVALILDAKKGISALQVCRHLNIPETNYKAVWYLCHRIREAMQEAGLLSGDVEADETYVGGKVPRKGDRHKPRREKDVVLGMVERKGRLRMVPVPDAKAAILQPVLEKNISEQVGTIYTDEHPIYIYALNRAFPGKHKTISHRYTYGIGSTHTNTIENAFSLFKRGLMGSFHHISTKHLRRYCDEFSFRFNRRHAAEGAFEETMRGLLNGKPLPYKALTASGTAAS